MGCHAHGTSEWKLLPDGRVHGSVRSPVLLQEQTGWETAKGDSSHTTFMTRSNVAAPHYTLRGNPHQAGGHCRQGAQSRVLCD